MAAPEGNNFWLMRSKHGRDKIFSSKEVLHECICDFFQVCLDNPWYKAEALKSGNEPGKLVYIPTVRPFTLKGLCNYLCISHQTWLDYKKREDYTEVIEWAESIIYTQKFEGAAVGAFNANLISRDLGLAEKAELVGKGDTDLFKDKTDDELKALLKDLSSKLNDAEG
jgi:hypothetical protein